MIRSVNTVKLSVVTAVFAGILGGCSSIKLPDMDFISFPEFKEEAENIPDYPKVADAPAAPKGIRTDEKWDQSARKIMATRDGFTDPDAVDAKTNAQVLREMRDLAAKVDEYKKDDPQ